MKILVIALSGIGDALMFTPALKLLRNDFPDAQIDTLVMFGGARDLYERLPYVDNVIHFNFMIEGYLRSLKFVLSLRGKYDASINVYPSNRKEYNIISSLIGAHKRLGVRYLRADLINMGFLNNLTITENDDLHNVEENIKLIELLSDKKHNNKESLDFPVCDEDVVFSEEFFNSLSVGSNELLIGFHAGCSVLKNHINRRWAPQKFAELAKLLIDDYNARIFIFGGPDEEELKKNIVKQINSDRAIAVQTGNLGQTAAVMKRINIFITNDSSLMHVASALQLKTVVIIGPTNINYIRPWQTEHKISSLSLDCAPCFVYSPKPLTCTRKDKLYKCVKDLNVDRVLDDVKSFL